MSPLARAGTSRLLMLFAVSVLALRPGGVLAAGDANSVGTAAAALAGGVETASVGGVADLKVTGGAQRVSLRVLFAASGDPARLRIEVVRAGTLVAVAWYDAARLLIFAPTEGLVHEGPPTRATLQSALGLPFCPADILHALRGGQPPQPPPCDETASSRVEASGEGDDAGIEIRRGGDTPTRLRFSRYREVAGRRWPHHVTLESQGARAVVSIVAISHSPLEPLPPAGAALGSARRVSADELATALGTRPEAGEAGAASEAGPYRERGR